MLTKPQTEASDDIFEKVSVIHTFSETQMTDEIATDQCVGIVGNQSYFVKWR